MNLDNKARIFKALSDTGRLRILKMLQVRSLCVCEITEVLGLATSTVSSHLSILRDAGFVVELKEGKWVNYMINTLPTDPVSASLNSIMHSILNDVEDIQRDRKILKTIDRMTICR